MEVTNTIERPLAKGNCFWGHKWTKWEQYNAQMLAYDLKTTYDQLKQKRYCVRCNKMETQIIGNTNN